MRALNDGLMVGKWHWQYEKLYGKIDWAYLASAAGCLIIE